MLSFTHFLSFPPEAECSELLSLHLQVRPKRFSALSGTANLSVLASNPIKMDTLAQAFGGAARAYSVQKIK